MDDYACEGYTIVDDLLAPAELAAVRAEAGAICRGARGRIDGLVPAPGDVDDAAAVAPYLCIHFPHKVSPLLLDVGRHPGAVATLTEVIGPNVKMMQSMLFIKATGKPGQAWHQDESHIPTRDRSTARRRRTASTTPPPCRSSWPRVAPWCSAATCCTGRSPTARRVGCAAPWSTTT